ncbi:nucleotide disphospho-sugar-binding domain-containing protein [Streptomyces sp. enrichment culture]|uniref:nucleotide disphospho-sugar-binding domain-containing protein n=1 Tax=Streptomyces sp. enrichment culture TaxID=1795815 RepID=UPI003F5648FD
MRVLFVGHGPAHVPWIVPLAWACRLAGHEVRVAVRPQCVPSVTRAGLVAVPVGDEAAAGAAAGRRLGLGPGRLKAAAESVAVLDADLSEALVEKMIAVADTLTDDLVDFARFWRPDIVVHDTAAAAGLVAAAAVGVPAVGHTWGVSLGVHCENEAELRPSYARLFERFGADPVVGPSVWIDPCPPGLRPPHGVRRADMRYVPFAGPAALPTWLRADRPADRPLVCVTGGVTTTALDEVRDHVVRSLLALDTEVVLALTPEQAAATGHLPDGVRMVVDFPLDVLLAHCDALVHHGGVGSGLIAVTHGLPQLLLPRNAFQEHWSHLVRASGAGTALPADAGASAVGTAVQDLLARPSYRERSKELRAETARMPAPDRLVGFLEECVRAGGTEIPTPEETAGR